MVNEMVLKETLKYFAEQARNDFSAAEENLHKIILELKASENKGLNYIETYDEENVRTQLTQLKSSEKKGRLFGVPITVKDAICVKGVESKAGSKILTGYKPTFDATVITKLKEEGAIILAKTTQDEFGFGTFNTNTEKVPKNPFDNERSCGGSSGGPAGFTAYTSRYHGALGESTGGSIACPSSFCGVTSLTPTYGLVSRYGLIDYANSMDKVGSVGRNIDDASLLLEIISGADEKDSTNLGEEFIADEGPTQKVAIIKDFFDNCDDSVKKVVQAKIDKMKEFIQVDEIELPLNIKYSLAAYYIIATSEASTNLAKLSGLRYGKQKDPEGKHFDEYFSEIRSENFTEEAKRRIILGTFARMSGFRDAYYLKAMKVRTKLINEFKSAFSKYDLLLTPTMPIVAPKFDAIEQLTPLQNYAMDLCTVPANLAGLPHASCNAGMSNGMPVGLMAIAPHLAETRLYSFGRIMEMK
ncbi:MAG: Asp-tRNA(Asn)/Glu-tRNA(Gln) amidotransferase subunit GatA [Candidatus Diapherotrites archaeon]|jgi:aspartyl-tRNA(Asn)/glutamyl-tRNA(Gln) amidotransferase subunit A|nr:Asp-tRNA(Asn)/Glu-tRNA(Gln) amidotransferase subunit GatA [Candidatus Diapherotrites archaeon]